MAYCTVEELCSEIYKKIRDDFPDLTFSQFKQIVKTPWNMVSQEMEGNDYTPVRLHNLGVFYSTEPMVKRGEKMVLHSEEKEILPPEEINRIKIKLQSIREYYETKSKD